MGTEVRKQDCTACKVVGAGGCFAGAIYAMYVRAGTPPPSSNRHWLATIAIGTNLSS